MKEFSRKLLQPSDWPLIDVMLGVTDMPMNEILRQQDRKSKFRVISKSFDNIRTDNESRQQPMKNEIKRNKSALISVPMTRAQSTRRPTSLVEMPNERNARSASCMGDIWAWLKRRCLNQREQPEACNKQDSGRSRKQSKIAHLLEESNPELISSLLVDLEKPLFKCDPDGSIICTSEVDLDMLIAGFMIYERSFRQGTLLPFANVLPRESKTQKKV
ncbi:hypothetical protein Ciccas_011990 [Cichlidogyrus casuarinus]|uniref:Uncharacterized protein n=1 Tax=Cichlidogyrus casuarinus TaxID=1844966 RepID=A0ABD2PPN8_9PLAT